MRTTTTLLLTAALALAGCGDGDGDDDVATATTTTITPPESTSVPVDTEVAVTVGGRTAELTQVCAGFDGAVVTDTAEGRRVILVREGGTQAIRVITAAGEVVESTLVEARPTGGGTIHGATIDLDGHPTLVELTVPEEVDLEPCPEGSSAG